jgi:hypothetical protein
VTSIGHRDWRMMRTHMSKLFLVMVLLVAPVISGAQRGDVSGVVFLGRVLG